MTAVTASDTDAESKPESLALALTRYGVESVTVLDC